MCCFCPDDSSLELFVVGFGNVSEGVKVFAYVF